MSLQSVFDYRSPYAYLANTRLPELNTTISYFPVDILEVMKKVNNQPSPACPAKAKYSGTDAGRWAAIYGVPLIPNGAFFQAMRAGQVEGAILARAAVAALEVGIFDIVHSALFEAVWAGTDDLVTPEGRAAFLQKLGLDVDIWQIADSPAVREQLAANNEEAARRGVFGVPTFFCGNEMFFGNDRLDFVRAALKKANGASQ
ncbi:MULTISPECIES: 2-hydroxychromene-2-carboxylate isomerase [unclassified Pseudomonas]|uniref:2-hydroxychromene-2-carboxylate isomerase n=1 Tax=unclassified Pseudomonas TaxID=196821 RepID=UPI00244A658C|nr:MULTISPECIES: 2-hydroxychromene-2-carboxylate isomerase [unclassified Pseudomonas]MDG9928985.1 2-hydroxychromene-2-carboxylate isomerase [Pseudomonas sp. GD04042]MDH0483846.1 2-hydroxychromene-2-carboxylate isomerase [Pseudomonas sp. GD04015]MDH0604311.1 2-hydroxychromene-2-carboxylate isomerase [Pseudomonas sp. GD03869]